MRNRFNLNEEEKNRIRGLHNINEQSISSPDGDDYDESEPSEENPGRQQIEKAEKEAVEKAEKEAVEKAEREAVEKVERESHLPDCSDYKHYNKMFEPVRRPNRPPPGSPSKSLIEDITFEYNNATWGPRPTIWITALKNGKAFCRVVSKHRGGDRYGQ